MNSRLFFDECRACLRQLGKAKQYQLFEPWPAPSPRRESLLANDLAALANIQILKTDKHSKAICEDCFRKLKDAWSFIETVKNSDSQLKNICTINNVTGDAAWPQPININEQVNGTIDNVEVEVKQEVLSDDEHQADMDSWEPTLDIKIEPEEIIMPEQSNVNGDITHESSDEEYVNGVNTCSYDEEHLESSIKEEPLSSSEDLSQEASSVECILCSKKFNSVAALKAHVISQHSYKTVKRKKLEPTPVESCDTCRKTFATRAELLEHEEEHKAENKRTNTCLVCRQRFSTLTLLSSHLCEGQHVPQPIRAEECIRMLPQHSYKTFMKREKFKPPAVEICNTCRRTFATRAELLDHEEEHKAENKRTNMCLVCRQRFGTLTLLSSHLCEGQHVPQPLRTYSNSTESQAHDTTNMEPKTEPTSYNGTSESMIEQTKDFKKETDKEYHDRENSLTVEERMELLFSADTQLQPSVNVLENAKKIAENILTELLQEKDISESDGFTGNKITKMLPLKR